MVAKVGWLLEVQGVQAEDEKLCEVACSCAFRVGVSMTNAGTPLSEVNEHRRIWSTVWQKDEDPVPSGVCA